MKDPTKDYRADAVTYFDRFATAPAGDVEFYLSRVTGMTRVLDLGCGTGRVLLPLAAAAEYVHGLDHSPAMLALCRKKLATAAFARNRTVVQQGDITDFDLTTRKPPFDLIIAPYRVMQNLEMDEQVEGLLHCIRRHLAPGGQAILNTFNPRFSPTEMKTFWDTKDGREPVATIQDGEETVELFENCLRHRDDPLTVYPELTYRRLDAASQQIDEAVLSIPMRVWYPDELLRLIETHGFEVVEKVGGYQGEPWGEGSELVVVFR